MTAPEGNAVLTRARGLVLAAHLGPTLAMTGLAAALVVGFGGSSADAVRLAACVLLGQASIGWSNDAHDAADDIAAERGDKPVVRGLVDARTVGVAAGVALGLCVAASFALLGPVSALWHVGAVAAAWAYNLWLKDTVASPLPYALAFAAVPVVVATLVSPDEPVPWPFATVGALVGVAVHLANTAAEVTSDRSVGRGGLACAIGSPSARALTVALLALAAALLVLLLPDLGGGVVLGLTLLVGVAAVAASVREGRLLFPAVLTVTGIGVAATLLLAVS